ncbi:MULTISPECIES: hypothetical protein [unclassified Flavobacterium]|uniref:hypothetical protein n=1 Tax=unclassified Flavobacterium TaxID=196869 RepID=UPI0012909877|nr:MULTISPECIES: hypothetical protein [unclassified Flavobacterium]MQP53750.1 hypothetical protein [Flavobacterium sp. LMO9]MQP63645.1 hypothetical protein [Flavobacterium sp. LMO6]
MKYLSLILVFSFMSCENVKEKKQDNIYKTEEIKTEKPKRKRNIILQGTIISDSTNTLENEIKELELNYIIWGCACANWITTTDLNKYGTSIENCIFIEPADDKLIIPNDYNPHDKIIVKGQFYKKKDYPHITRKMEEDLEKAKVFRYTELKIIKGSEK